MGAAVTAIWLVTGAARAAISHLVDVMGEPLPGTDVLRYATALNYTVLGLSGMGVLSLSILAVSVVVLRTDVLARWIGYVGAGCAVIIFAAWRPSTEPSRPWWPSPGRCASRSPSGVSRSTDDGSLRSGRGVGHTQLELAPMSQQVLELPGGPLELWRSGVGPTVLVAHGCGFGGSFCNNTWLAQELQNYHVISVSRPGYGETPLSTATTFHAQADMYVDVLDAVGVEDCVVLGMSASGPIALLAARDHAPRVRGLVLWCAVARSLPAHEIDEDQTSLDADVLEQEQAAEREVLTQMLSDDSFAFEALPELLRPAEMVRYALDPLVRAGVRSYLEGLLAAPPAVAAVRNDLLQMRALLGEGLDSRVAVPMLVMHGDDDDTVPVRPCPLPGYSQSARRTRHHRRGRTRLHAHVPSRGHATASGLPRPKQPSGKPLSRSCDDAASIDE